MGGEDKVANGTTPPEVGFLPVMGLPLASVITVLL